jgi:hypothetical protein
MERETVESTMIASVGYDPETKTLEVEFQDGGIWQYKDVPDEEYRALMDADSKGGHMNDSIIGVYPEVRIQRGSDS